MIVDNILKNEKHKIKGTGREKVIMLSHFTMNTHKVGTMCIYEWSSCVHMYYLCACKIVCVYEQ